MCISGYCAGNVEVVLPAEARSASSVSVSTQWMVENWNRWVYLDCAVDEVFVLDAQAAFLADDISTGICILLMLRTTLAFKDVADKYKDCGLHICITCTESDFVQLV